MLLKLHTPQPPLSDFVELFTYYEDYAPTHSIERVLPEGVVEIIVDLTDDPKWTFDNATLKRAQSYKRAWISGMRSKFISIGVAGRSAMFIIRFKAGKAYPFLQMPLREVDNMVIDYDSVMNGEFTDFRSALIEAVTPEAKFALAERFILQRMKNHLDINPVAGYIVNSIVANPCTSTISEIVQRTGYSHKHLLSLFGKYVGLSPKEFLRLTKFQQTILRIEQLNHVDWSQLAHDCGYYDQAHFINDFKEFSGLSPTAYIAKKTESDFVNYIPVR